MGGKMAAAYLALSNASWAEQIHERRPARCVFWRRDHAAFSVIRPGSPFFILERQKARRPVHERKVIGSAAFRLSRSVPLGQLIDGYGMDELGVSSVNQVMERWSEFGGHPNSETPVGVIELGPFEAFATPIFWEELHALGINVSPNLRQGMGLDSLEVERLFGASRGEREYSKPPTI
jgi:hypothetical protein